MIAGLPERLRQLRIQNKLTQKDIAGLLRLSPSIVRGTDSQCGSPITIIRYLSNKYRLSAWKGQVCSIPFR